MEESLRKAREYDRIGNVGKAFAYYIIFAKLSARRSEIEETFTDVLCKTFVFNLYLYLKISEKFIFFITL